MPDDAKQRREYRVRSDFDQTAKKADYFMLRLALGVGILVVAAVLIGRWIFPRTVSAPDLADDSPPYHEENGR